MERLLKVATPPLAATVVVPSSLPPVGPEAIASVTLDVLPLPEVTRLPYGSTTSTVTAGLIVAPAAAPVGCWLKTTAEADAAVTVTGALVPCDRRVRRVGDRDRPGAGRLQGGRHVGHARARREGEVGGRVRLQRIGAA